MRKLRSARKAKAAKQAFSQPHMQMLYVLHNIMSAFIVFGRAFPWKRLLNSFRTVELSCTSTATVLRFTAFGHGVSLPIFLSIPVLF